MADKPKLTAVGAGQDPPNRPRARSSVAFPYADLAEAERAVHQVAGSMGQCRPEQLAAWLGHGTLNSGAFRNKVAAAKQFGLLEGERNLIRLTDLGRRLSEASGARQARVEAFLSPGVYRTIFEAHRGRRMPGNLGIELEMVRLGVSRSQAKPARRIFVRSAEHAGFLESGGGQLVLPRGTVFPPPATGAPAGPRPSGYPRMIDAILEMAPWDSVWTEAGFEEWAGLFVKAARIHFKLAGEPSFTSSGEPSGSGGGG